MAINIVAIGDRQRIVSMTIKTLIKVTQFRAFGTVSKNIFRKLDSEDPELHFEDTESYSEGFLRGLFKRTLNRTLKAPNRTLRTQNRTPKTPNRALKAPFGFWRILIRLRIGLRRFKIGLQSLWIGFQSLWIGLQIGFWRLQWAPNNLNHDPKTPFGIRRLGIGLLNKLRTTPNGLRINFKNSEKLLKAPKDGPQILK